MPGNFLFSTPKIAFPPPQQYEIARIAKFESIDNLLDFAIDRSKIGVLLNMPVCKKHLKNILKSNFNDISVILGKSRIIGWDCTCFTRRFNVSESS